MPQNEKVNPVEIYRSVTAAKTEKDPNWKEKLSRTMHGFRSDPLIQAAPLLPITSDGGAYRVICEEEREMVSLETQIAEISTLS